jgi:hypothetical protein
VIKHDRNVGEGNKTAKRKSNVVVNGELINIGTGGTRRRRHGARGGKLFPDMVGEGGRGVQLQVEKNFFDPISTLRIPLPPCGLRLNRRARERK